MRVTLDGQDLFDGGELKIELGSLSRDSIERTVAGLDGMLSIDLGQRGRKIKQSGVLRTKSRWQMNERVSAILMFVDGNTHKLTVDGDEEFDGLRMDVFRVSSERVSGGWFCCDYEIIYAQLAV